MIRIYNAADRVRVLTLDFDPRLRDLLESRFTALADLLDWTEFVIVEPGDTEADIVREVGFSPLVEPIDGVRFGEEGFQPFWDHFVDHGGWFELSVSFGSSFAYVLLISAEQPAWPELYQLCRSYVGTSG
ncbi:hypothetical protein [Sphingomonas jatrophae]|uniref:Uncharacterized protein n=1 Tax=Sphingomonas jatrophae TaxID=1166337 RepID=A0A1I6K0I0_9SPHN|nr:hypothetical protein [Sphingomonas jatrophae]SFR84739.1 hypothetical protein SAMN05192580_1172 [Sphingomonas jatrophae]